MTLLSVVAGNSLTASPIGCIPIDFMRMSDLCHAAHIRYNDDIIDGVKIRTWRIRADASVERWKTTCNSFTKFGMLIDLIAHKNPTWDRHRVLAESLNPIHGKTLLMSRRDLNNHLAGEGVYGYDVIQGKKSFNADQLPDL